MNKAERTELMKIITGLASNFGDGLDDYGIELWIKGFTKDGFTMDQIRRAAGIIFRTKKIPKMPTYAEFVSVINGELKDIAEVQADVVLQFLRRFGSGVTPTFADPVTDKLMKVRWPYRSWARTLMDDKITFWIREFKEAYQSYSRLGVEKVKEIESRKPPANVKQLIQNIGREE